MMIARMFRAFNISASGLSAQRKNLQVRAENIAKADSVDRDSGLPYRAQDVQFSSRSSAPDFGRVLDNQRLALRRTQMAHMSSNLPSSNTEEKLGVEAQIVEPADQRTKSVYAPDHPNADADGYVEFPDIDSIDEMVKLMAASRAYEANATVLSAAKDMFKKALDI